ncbi:MAG: GTPase ObgE [Candidatus Peribacteraceae bacterium]|nr:GTPase ObgE [Candidatus Peribacteraceae bacterium]
MFLDEVEISIRAGKGGAGSVSFHREKYVTKGGPDGGHGGHGGNVLIRATANRNTLHHFKGVKLFTAENGEGGAGQLRAGKGGADLTLEVPVGTLVLDNGKLVADLVSDGQTFLAAHGGLGGKGNSNFTSSTRQLPRFAELGEPGEEKRLKLELKLLADIGIIGLPSVGKSTLISVISKARPKIAAYHFTTLQPNLGVVEHFDENFVVSDMPGLIRGASRGKGLGHQFLRHAERVRLFWHLLDGTSPTPLTDYKTIREELRKFNPELAEKPEILIVSKADICENNALQKLKTKIEKKTGKPVFIIAAPTHRGTKELLDLTTQELQKTKSETKVADPEIPTFRPHLEAKSKSFSVTKKNKRLFLVEGPRLNQIVVMSDVANPEALARVQDVLSKFGVNRELVRAGAEAGVTIEIAGKRFEWWG